MISIELSLIKAAWHFNAARNIRMNESMVSVEPCIDCFPISVLCNLGSLQIAIQGEMEPVIVHGCQQCLNVLDDDLNVSNIQDITHSLRPTSGIMYLCCLIWKGSLPCNNSGLVDWLQNVKQHLEALLIPPFESQSYDLNIASEPCMLRLYPRLSRTAYERTKATRCSLVHPHGSILRHVSPHCRFETSLCVAYLVF